MERILIKIFLHLIISYITKINDYIDNKLNFFFKILFLSNINNNNIDEKFVYD